MSFFFYGSGDLPDLHSFPTRRSSDLAVVRSSPSAPKSMADAISSWPAGRGAQRHLWTLAGGALSSTDRKSTRLNSSHRTISYAVFCLKKKKKSEVYHAHPQRPHARAS